MEKMSNKTNVAMQACQPTSSNSLTRRKENSSKIEEDNMALSVSFTAFLALSALSRTFEPRSWPNELKWLVCRYFDPLNWILSQNKHHLHSRPSGFFLGLQYTEDIVRAVQEDEDFRNQLSELTHRGANGRDRKYVTRYCWLMVIDYITS
jgi:hypothetical protein